VQTARPAITDRLLPKRSSDRVPIPAPRIDADRKWPPQQGKNALKKRHPCKRAAPNWCVRVPSSSCATLLAPKDVVATVHRGASLASIAGHARALADGPLVVVGPRQHVEVLDGIELGVGHVKLPDFDVVIVPAEGLAGLDARDELGPCDVKENAGHCEYQS
jgi:hypothetical protein